MTIDSTLAAHPVVAALARVDEAISEALPAAWSLRDDDVVAMLAESERLAARLAGLHLKLVSEADARGVASDLGAPSTAALLRERLRIRPGDAKARVRLASNPELAATREAVTAGRVSTEHAAVIAGTLRRLPEDLPEDVRADAQAFLLEQAGTFDPEQLGRLGKHLRHVVDPDGVEPEEQAALGKRELSGYDRGDGTHALRGVLDNKAYALVMAVLDPLAAPRPAADGTPDPRPAKRRRADALVEALGRLLDHGDLPAHRGARPHVTITAGLDTLLRLPDAPAADTTWGGPLSAEALRRIACDAGVSFVLLDSHGVPLDVGREHRSVTPGLWTALVVRDRGCVFPGCTRPPEWCAAHHVRHWSDGGPTSLDNLALLCGHHHRTVHHKGWAIQFGSDRHPELIPPRWIDPDQGPQRNPYWHLRC